LNALVNRYHGPATLKEILNVSQVEVAVSSSNEIRAETLPADGLKCERCWNYSTHVGEDSRWPTVCERCSAALSQIGFPPEPGA
jgi:isoleucyl-tRNA synthetase